MPELVAEVGSVLVQRYALERELGRGGMATVYLARDEKLGRMVALKLLRPELGAALGPERFLREIAVVSRLSHPHILPLYESGEVDGRLFYVMPYVEGESLRQRLVRERQLPIGETLAIVRAVAGALDHAHQAGVIHRDIKPENILLARDPAGGPPHPLVADFGIARALNVAGGERLTETGLAVGTPSYMSPEQAAGGTGVDGRSDVYALGCVAYELLAGTPPFTGPTAQAIMARHAVDPVPPLETVRPTVPEPVASAIERALAKVPADRFATAGEFAAALVRAPARSGLRRRWGLRQWLNLGFGGTVALATLAGANALWRRAHAPSVLPVAATMAVLPFRSGTADTALDRLGRDLAITLSATLDGLGGIRTTDRLSVAAATVHERDLSAADAATLARRLGASSVVRGTVVWDGNAVRVDLDLFDAKALTPLAHGVTITGHRDSLGALTDSAAWGILRQVWLRGEPPSPSLAAVTTHSVPALRAFLDGERLLELDRWEDAGLAYRSAIASDSTFWLARFRDLQTQAWRVEDINPKVVDQLYRHRESFPEPDRLILDSWSESRRNTPSLQLAMYREVTRRFPDYWPGWLALGDWLLHVGPMAGHGWGEAQTAFRRAVDLNPRLLPVWLHMFGNSVGKDTLESGRALAGAFAARALRPDSSVAMRHHRTDRLGQAVAQARGILDSQTRVLADSVARDWIASPGFPPWGFLWSGYPAAQIELNRMVMSLDSSWGSAVVRLRWSAWAWAERGAWDSALGNMREAVQLESDPVTTSGPTALDRYQLAVLGAWLGALPPMSADTLRPAVRSMLSAERDSSRRAELLGSLAWLDGLVAFTRRDQVALQRARRDGLASQHRQSGLIDRSLHAFGRALAGDRQTAGRELADLEWQCADRWDCHVDVPNIAVQRLAAATWLLEAGDSLQAARLLVWHEAMQPGPWWSTSFATTPLAYLLLARMEDAEGKLESARAHYQQFLRRYDSPMPAQQHLVEETRVALARLGASE